MDPKHVRPAQRFSAYIAQWFLGVLQLCWCSWCPLNDCGGPVSTIRMKSQRCGVLGVGVEDDAEEEEENLADILWGEISSIERLRKTICAVTRSRRQPFYLSHTFLEYCKVVSNRFGVLFAEKNMKSQKIGPFQSSRLVQMVAGKLVNKIVKSMSEDAGLEKIALFGN